MCVDITAMQQIINEITAQNAIALAANILTIAVRKTHHQQRYR